jgi:hypothetical protein
MEEVLFGGVHWRYETSRGEGWAVLTEKKPRSQNMEKGPWHRRPEKKPQMLGNSGKNF